MRRHVYPPSVLLALGVKGWRIYLADSTVSCHHTLCLVSAVAFSKLKELSPPSVTALPELP